MAIQEKQMGQLRPANTTPASLYSPGASTTGVILSISVCNTSGAPAKYRIFKDNDGTTYDETTARYWDILLAADSTDEFKVFWAMNDANGNLAVRTDTNDALTFTVDGYEVTP